MIRKNHRWTQMHTDSRPAETVEESLRPSLLQPLVFISVHSWFLAPNFS
jgi:hypothetical protein